MTDQPPKARRGCLFYGCIIGVVFMLMLLAGLLVGMRYLKKTVNLYTDSSPMALPALKLSSAEIEQVRARAKTFVDSASTNSATEPLVLNSDEINALISSEKETQNLKGKMYFNLEGDKVKAQISLPMEDLGLRLFRKRYLNGEATLKVSLQNGSLRVYAEDIRVKGKPFPSTYMESIRQRNLAQGFDTDPKISEALNKLESIEIKEGKLIVKPAAPTPPPQGQVP